MITEVQGKYFHGGIMMKLGKKILFLICLGISCCLLFTCVTGQEFIPKEGKGPGTEQKERQPGEPFPQIQPFQTGYLKAGNLHELYYECCGNPKGKPVMVLHGGPGYGCYPAMRTYFNPGKFFIVLHDQRGAGKSKPYAETRENTTQLLVQDIENLRKHLGIDTFLLFGGSWGTTLGLAYAETYPDRVSGMVLRGIYTGSTEEIEFHYRGVRNFFPERYDKLQQAMPPDSRELAPDYVYKLLQGSDVEKQKEALVALGSLEFKMMRLEVADNRIDRFIGVIPFEQYKKSYLIDLYYASNRYFLEEGQLLRNSTKIQHIPAIIINGRYDMACPPWTAFRLHKQLPKSKLIIAEKSGHSESETEIAKAIILAVAEFEDK